MATFQARTNIMSALSCCLSFSVIIITIAAVTKPAMVNAGHPSKPSVLVVYDHQNTVPPNNTALIAVQPSGPTAPPVGSGLTFGEVFVLSNNARAGPARDSPIVGQVDGQRIILLNSFYISVAYVLNNPHYAGSIIAQGVADFSGNGELAILGGSGHFRKVTGYVDLSPVSAVDPSDVVFKAVLHISYN